MLKFTKRRSRKSGLPPGTLIHIGEKKTEKARITVTDYDLGKLREKTLEDIAECYPLKDEPTTTWINIDGMHDIDLIEKIGSHFQIHPLVLEDIVNTGQRPKVEDFEDYLFIVIKMLYHDKENDEVKSEQISLILGPHYLITFQEIEGDVFHQVRDRIRRGRGRIRKGGSDYLAYALIDAIVDEYFAILELLGEKIEALEEELHSDPTQEILQRIHNLKHNMIYMRKQIWPLREIVTALRKAEFGLVQEATGIFFADVYDHTIQVIDTIESFRDILSGMMDLYLSAISNRMNEVMKVLTIIATIFIPLTFLAGIYGMNFKYMPELEWHWAYPAVWVLMILVTVFMVFYFRKKKWL
ncbi:magnesium/cobalt transporter CorA [Thermodesulfobacteriota bacterium]